MESMRAPTGRILPFFAVVCAVVPAAAAPIDAWHHRLIAARASLRPNMTFGHWIMTERVEREIPGGEGMTCLEYGRHTREIPAFDPMAARRQCLSDPLPDSAGFQAAWRAVIDKVRRDGGEPVAHTPPIGPVYYQQAVGLGNTGGMGRDGQTRLEGHWGDAAGLDLKLANGRYEVVGGWIYTFRAYTYDLGGRILVMAERAVFHADSQGRLISVIRHHGELAPATGAFMWPPMPSSMDGPNGASVIHQIQWRQLVKSWAD